MPTRSSLSAPAPRAPGELASLYRETRARTEMLAAPLSPEDQCVQSMPDASPAKWHRAHTSWFFETFILAQEIPGYRPHDREYGFLFNSYYEAVGPRHTRAWRGLITRPGAEEITRYREAVDARMAELMESADEASWARIAPLIELGCHHEQQHQELLLTDILHAFAFNPVRPAYQSRRPREVPRPVPLSWTGHEGGIVEIGHEGGAFAFDNEGPRHATLLHPFEIANRPVTQREWQDFIEDGGYTRPDLWLSDGWAMVQAEGWEAPLYWERGEGSTWWVMTLAGFEPINPQAPVAHLSFYEADAYARWAGARLPSEAEWEHVAAALPVAGNFVESGALRPQPLAAAGSGPRQMFGDVWEWTANAYRPYPGYRAPAGAVGEYNGKFMCNQFVLRGGSCASPQAHLRASYRNFFYPHQRWQFAGVRLARDAD